MLFLNRSSSFLHLNSSVLNGSLLQTYVSVAKNSLSFLLKFVYGYERFVFVFANQSFSFAASPYRFRFRCGVREFGFHMFVFVFAKKIFPCLGKFVCVLGKVRVRFERFEFDFGVFSFPL